MGLGGGGNVVLPALPPYLGSICFECSRLVGGRRGLLHMFLRTRVIAPDVSRALWLQSFALVFNEKREIRSERAARAAHNFNLRFIPMCIKLGLQMGRGLAKAEQSF